MRLKGLTRLTRRLAAFGTPQQFWCLTDYPEWRDRIDQDFDRDTLDPSSFASLIAHLVLRHNLTALEPRLQLLERNTAERTNGAVNAFLNVAEAYLEPSRARRMADRSSPQGELH